MTRPMRSVILFVLVAFVAGPACFAEGSGGGRYMKGENPFSVSFNAGLIGFDKGEVRETRRAYDNEGGAPDYSAFLSAYTIEDLNFEDQYPALGTTIEKQWQFVTLQLNATYANPSADAVAKMKSTASNVPADQRGYYIGVEEAIYNGRNYEYMWIPDGTKFKSDITTLLTEIKTMVTPFHLGAGGVHFSPWFSFGIYGGVANYEIDAGPAEGTIWYEVPPKQYVVKGKGTGTAGMAVPQIGGGGELRIDFGSRTNRPASLVVQGDVGWMHFDGAPGSVGFNVESTRNITFNWLNVKLDVFLEMPISKRVDLLVGASYRAITTDVTLDSVHRDRDVQEVLSEKYDKYAEFAFTQYTANIGLRF